MAFQKPILPAPNLESRKCAAISWKSEIARELLWEVFRGWLG